MRGFADQPADQLKCLLCVAKSSLYSSEIGNFTHFSEAVWCAPVHAVCCAGSPWAWTSTTRLPTPGSSTWTSWCGCCPRLSPASPCSTPPPPATWPPCTGRAWPGQPSRTTSSRTPATRTPTGPASTARGPPASGWCGRPRPCCAPCTSSASWPGPRPRPCSCWRRRWAWCSTTTL